MSISCPHVEQIADFSAESISSLNSCEICGICGPNLWICISSECNLFVGCGEGVSDHSTQHFRLNPSHRLTINSTTFRIWCYHCQQEVFIDHKDNINEIVPKPIQANEVYVADISDEEITDEEEVLIGYYDCN
jgi:ubiquitin carboxyl-terminal hydrolase 20/33